MEKGGGGDQQEDSPQIIIPQSKLTTPQSMRYNFYQKFKCFKKEKFFGCAWFRPLEQKHGVRPTKLIIGKKALINMGFDYRILFIAIAFYFFIFLGTELSQGGPFIHQKIFS